MTVRPTLSRAFTCLCLILIAPVILTPAALADTEAAVRNCADEPYEVRPEAARDVILSPTNFLRCTTGDYALCYYSGADPLPCTVEESGTSADCVCQVFTATESQPMYVDIHSILDRCVWEQTVKECGEDGSGCFNICNQKGASKACDGVELPSEQHVAAVCGYIAEGTFDDDAAYISTFSFQQVNVPKTDVTFEIGCSERKGRYAGCMTASCSRAENDGNGHSYTSCSCPIWPRDDSMADYQVGRACRHEEGDPKSALHCKLQDDQVWSAANNPDGCS